MGSFRKEESKKNFTKVQFPYISFGILLKQISLSPPPREETRIIALRFVRNPYEDSNSSETEVSMSSSFLSNR